MAVIAVAADKAAPIVQVKVSCVAVGVPLAAEQPLVAVPVQTMADEPSAANKLDGVVRITLPPLGTALTVVNPKANQPVGVT